MSKKSGSQPAPGNPASRTATADPAIPPGGGARMGLLRGAQVMIALALGITLYLAYTSVVNGSVAGCGAGSDCNAVLTSRWAYWFNVPVSTPAALFYVGVLIASALTSPARSPRAQARAWTLLIAGAFGLLGAALWFVGLQGAIIGSWCPYCLAAHLLGGTGALLVLLAAPFVIRGRDGTEPLLFGVSQRAMPAVLGMLTLVPLVVGQFLSKPPSAALATVAPATAGKPPSEAPASSKAPPPATNSAAAMLATNPASAPAKPSRKLELHAGRFSFELYDAPMFGQPTAPHVAVSLFDYTCAHCRVQHPLLKRVQATFSNDLAIVLLPMPLDKACNPLLAATGPEHVNACEYARIGMAVWRAKPAALAAYEEWFFEPTKPRPVAEARAKAIELTGRPDLDTVMADPWIDDWLKLGRDVFKANWDRTGRNFLPMLNVGAVLSSGKLESDDELYGILEQHVGLKRPASAGPGAQP